MSIAINSGDEEDAGSLIRQTVSSTEADRIIFLKPRGKLTNTPSRNIRRVTAMRNLDETFALLASVVISKFENDPLQSMIKGPTEQHALQDLHILTEQMFSSRNSMRETTTRNAIPRRSSDLTSGVFESFIPASREV